MPTMLSKGSDVKQDLVTVRHGNENPALWEMVLQTFTEETCSRNTL
jgi:hypothetical protein